MTPPEAKKAMDRGERAEWVDEERCYVGERDKGSPLYTIACGWTFKDARRDFRRYRAKERRGKTSS